MPRFISENITISFVTVLMVILAGWLWFDCKYQDGEVSTLVPTDIMTFSEITPTDEPDVPSIVEPLDQSAKRVTKKPFGILINQATSPVQPERFSGYHTGVDFEAFASETMTDVVVRAICSGEILVKRRASGYGGVIVTSCVIDGKDVTVVYGHLRLSSIIAKVGEQVVAGDQMGLLGTGASGETDGERKHLHLGIHRGATPTLLGYVSTSDDLSSWIDPCLYVCQ